VAGVPVIRGEYFFLHDRHRAHRPAAHERADALACFRSLGASAFVKPLTGSRGDFAQAVHGEAALARYLDNVAKYYDAVLIQPIVDGVEYRIFLLDDDALFCARKQPPFVRGDGVHNLRELLAAHNDALRARGLSPVSPGDNDSSLDAVLAKDEKRNIPGRMNLSAGGTMVLEPPPSAKLVELARAATRALGLRVAAVDLFAGIGGEASAMTVIEVNSNPSIRLLEQSGRGDLILKIWHHTFCAMGLL
jgi:glutathione synthase/RimK-type ligase-like ATP-grasp enzyme